MPCLTLPTTLLQVLGVIALLMRLMGLLPALACLAVSLAVVPINLLVLRTQTRLRRQTLVHTDARVKLTGEVLSGGAAGWTAPCSSCFGSLRGGIMVPCWVQCCMVLLMPMLLVDRRGAVAVVNPATTSTLRLSPAAGIKAVKLYAWEAPFTQRILAIRRRELRCVRNSALVGLIDSASFETTPILVALAAFGTYVWQVGVAECKQCLHSRHLGEASWGCKQTLVGLIDSRSYWADTILVAFPGFGSLVWQLG